MSVSPLADDVATGRLRQVRAVGDRLAARIRRVRALDVAWAALAVVLSLACGWTLVGWQVTLWSLGAGVALGVVIGAFTSDHPLYQGAGAVLTIPAGLLSIAGLVVAVNVWLSSPVRGVVVWVTVTAVGAVGFAAVLAPTGIGAGRMRRTVARAWIVLVGPVAVLALLILPDLALVGQLGGVVRSFLALFSAHLLGTRATFAPVVFPALATVTVWTLRSALRGLPFDALASSESRERVASALSHADRGLTVALRVAGISLVVLPLVSAVSGSAPTLAGLRAALPAGLAPIVTLLQSSTLRLCLLGVFVLAGGALAGHQALVRARRVPLEHVARALVPSTAATLTALAGGQWLGDDRLVEAIEVATGRTLGSDVAALVGQFDPFVLGVTLAVVVSGAALVLLTALVSFVRVALPSRATGSALAGTALFTLAMVLTLAGRTGLGLAVGALALVIWDAGVHAQALGEELGVSKTARAELVHLSGTLVIGVVAVAGAVGLVAAAAGTTVTGGASELVALVFATVGATLLLYSL